MDVLSRQYILQIVPVISPFCLPRYEVEEGCLTGGKKKTHHIKSDHIVSLMAQFVSQFCQNHFAELPRVQCLQAANPSVVIYYTPDAL